MRRPPILLTIVILTELVDFVVLFEVAIFAIFPNVATAGIEERVVTSAIRELDMAVVSISHDGLGLKDWFQCEHRKKQCDDREDRLCVKVNAHVTRLQFRDFHFAPSAIVSSLYRQFRQRNAALKLANTLFVVCSKLHTS